MQAVKHTFLKILRHAGVNSVARRMHARGILVLSYHGVVSHPQTTAEFPYSNTVHQDEFAYQLDVLRRLFQPISAADWIDALEGRGRLPERPALVTFDDGYRNNLINAAPVLERYGVPALISVCPAYIGADRLLWSHELYFRIVHWSRPTFPIE